VKTDFKVGDLVDVIDRRDGAVVATGAKIKNLRTENRRDIGLSGVYADLDAGFGCSVRCLVPHGEPS
jgi:hypothetical protein